MGFWNDQPTNRGLGIFLAVLTSPVRLIVWTITRLFGYDIAAPGSEASGDGIITFFAGLLTTQAAALVIIAQGKSTISLKHLAIYTAFAILPLAGIVWVVLRKRVALPDGAVRHAFSQATISFGRWALFYGLILAVALPFLGALGWIPGQKTRSEFTESHIPCFAVRTGAVPDLKGHSNKAVKDWLLAQVKGLAPTAASGRQLVVVEQDGSFAADYLDFVSSFSFGANVIATDTKAYLIRNATDPDGMPTFELLPALPRDEGGQIAKHVVQVKSPSNGDFLVLFLTLEKRDPDGDPLPTNAEGYHFLWRVK